MGKHHDPMNAVARLRRVRERDSLLGLHQARQESAQAQARVEDLHRRLDAAVTGPQDLQAYAAQRLAMVAVEQAATTAREAAQASEAIAETAQAHWQVDRVRLEAIEMLLERRAEARLRDRREREAREADDLATQSWSRREREAS